MDVDKEPKLPMCVGCAGGATREEAKLLWLCRKSIEAPLFSSSQGFKLWRLVNLKVER